MSSKVDLSRSQMVGATAIACLLIFFLALPNILPAHPSLIVSELDSSQLEYVSLEDEMDSTVAEDRQDEIIHYKSEKELFNFDPNTLDQKGFEDLGFSSKQTKSILKYRSSYGPFKSPEEFGKIYVKKGG